MGRGTAVEISLAALKHNYELVKVLTNNRRVIATVKADAYGHGAIEVASALEKLGVYCLGVAYAPEALELRQAGIQKIPILVYFDNIDAADIIKYELTPIVYGAGTADTISAEALKQNRQIDIHVDIDTGMGRVGFLYDRDIEGIKALSRLKGVRVTGFMSHFSEADLKDRSFAELQLERYLHLRSELSGLFKDATWHIANSAAVMSFPASHLDAVRPGLVLYGSDSLEPSHPRLETADFRPVMTVKSRILHIRRVPSGRSISYGRTFVTKRASLVGVVSTGYADGYPRALSNKAHVLINGQFAPIIGRICMDVAMVDLTDCCDIKENTEVILIGRQGGKEITASEIAAWAGTISYEILISLGRVNSRTYCCDEHY
ncbi:alanine racemase [Candidatus Magnetominusculus xianensis]|uniref:Alanine racemase n=1 Tax=Candidatus Magnetominusculus xianensis TaxID=1748249 RepID=A0ABR5SIP3_9BACT|nr:alanine racemase [Candidatus Magnetominusculus xianensis]KWT92808.1 alanine racemase [Candidatus Magnetominusculus xianensis]MBF0403396.1 alanine racemase [Nitrospirota bacterium]